VLFLTGFPQVNWGYHVLTDSLGYVTAFSSGLLAFSVWRRHASGGIRGWDGRAIAALAALWCLQAVSFFARETAWFTPVVVAALFAMGPKGRRELTLAAGLVLLLVSARLPYSAYLAATGVEPIKIPYQPNLWWQPAYMLDFLIKSAVAFNVAWLPALLAAWNRLGEKVSRFCWAWGAAAVLYMGAGYAHNSLGGVGYPLRLTYALFPVVYWLAACWVERLPRQRQPLAVLGLVAVNVAMSAIGVALDPGHSFVL
jgi:hypothetical protein